MWALFKIVAIQKPFELYLNRQSSQSFPIPDVVGLLRARWIYKIWLVGLCYHSLVPILCNIAYLCMHRGWGRLG